MADFIELGLRPAAAVYIRGAPGPAAVGEADRMQRDDILLDIALSF